MTTDELIKQARYCRTLETPDFCGDGSCPYFDTKGNCGNELLNDLADRLEKACKDMKYGIETIGCNVCKKDADICNGECTFEWRCEFEWRGDEDDNT